MEEPREGAGNTEGAGVIVDEEIRALIPPLQPEERGQLEENLRREGCREPLVIWKERRILLDGHHRKAICEELGIPYAITELEFGSREEACDWVDANQLGRRNLTPDQAALLRGRRYNRQKKSAGFVSGETWTGNPGGLPHSVGGQNVHPQEKTAQAIAAQYGVTERTIRRDGKFANAVEKLAALDPQLPRQVAKGKAVPKAAVMEAARLLESRPEKAQAILAGEITHADAVRELRREQIRETLQNTQVLEAKALAGVYDVIVIDPPWPMQKIERDERPQQTEFDYPTMTEEELAQLHIPCAEDSHVWLWTTQRFLPLAFNLLDRWQLKYICTFVWHKPGGFQPFGLPQYNCEFALYARRGTPQFIDTKAFPLCFTAARGKHSEKPEEFYDLLRRVTAGRRLDMFNRRAIEGFDGWGKEAAQ